MKSYIYIGITFLLVVLTACHNHKHEGDAHAGHSHDTNLQLSGYNDRYEVYAEVAPLAVGKNSSLLVHLTALDNFKPVSEAVVTASLIVGKKGIRQTLEVADQPGIYRFQLQPEVAGEGKLLVDVKAGGNESQIRMEGIRVFDDAHTAEHTAEAEAPHYPNAIAFTKEQSWKIDFATRLPVIDRMGQVIKTTAQILPSQGDEAIVTARSSGVVVFPNNPLVEGKSISSGQELLTISGAGMAENNISVKFTEAQNNFQKAEADYKRALELVKEKIVSEKEFMQVKSEYETSKAIYDNLYKNYTDKGQRVSSPISGFVRRLFVSNGQYVEAGQPLVSVSANRTLLLKADVSPKYAPLLPLISTANIRSMDKETVYSLEDLNGKVLSFGRSVNDNNFLIPVIFQMDNKAGFVSGGFVEVYIRTRSEQEVMAIPNTALTEEQGVYFVYVQLTPESFEKREVTTGVTDGLLTEIRSGISKDERVVTRGAISVKLAQSAGALDPHAGHVH